LIEADFIVKDLSDALMIQIMDNENREVYGSSPASMIEAVKAVVAALAIGLIKPIDDERDTNGKGVCYAPSYVPENYTSEGIEPDKSKRYTPIAIARFLGRTRTGGKQQEERASTAVKAALDFLCLKELGKVDNSLLVKEGRPIASYKLAEITTEIKQRHVAEVVRRGKTQAELNALREKQLAAQKKAKEDEEKAEAEHKALVKKLADAQSDEQNKKADALKAELKAKDERAKAKEVLNKLRVVELDEKIAQKKAWEAEQQVQDAYKAIRRDVECLLLRWETKVSERDAEREQVKSLAKLRDLKPADRLRLRKAAVAVADYYNDWVAARFAPLPTGKQELKGLSKREATKRRAEKEKE
jgi:flagellar biosynthesis GTPase FlhF